MVGGPHTFPLRVGPYRSARYESTGRNWDEEKRKDSDVSIFCYRRLAFPPPGSKSSGANPRNSAGGAARLKDDFIADRPSQPSPRPAKMNDVLPLCEVIVLLGLNLCERPCPAIHKLMSAMDHRPAFTAHDDCVVVVVLLAAGDEQQ
jgi:hypothetical protein